MKHTVCKICVGLIFAVSIASISGCAKYGALPEGERLERISQSPNYRDGEFRTLDPVPPQRGSVITGWISRFFIDKERPIPTVPVPYIKTDLLALDKDTDLIIWLGHASYYLQFKGKRYLVDPVFSDHASPLFFVNKAFEGSVIYSADDFPPIDYLLITHDHWDHLDCSAVLALKDKVGAIITPLGVGAHFEHWGFPLDMVHELDWHDTFALADDVILHALPALHYSGRTTTRNKTLWAAYALISPEKKLYLGGDSGYGRHYKMAGEAFDDFDLAMLDSGQYTDKRNCVHMMPEETALAEQGLNAKAIIHVHTATFSKASTTLE